MCQICQYAKEYIGNRPKSKELFHFSAAFPTLAVLS